ncbi:cyclin-dependent kinase inhibitor 6 [Phtheirospermum japonicum]|uniref:Cyclin-dependent kinase inhibitor n=1 Tax=Phtheirospermum japonicum TaxID=374723 RepID=A0A830D5G2_9LAMI|nr:cyclin-dependent kinase inhibitor 6 [Phtheirospermum japonicum]
MGRYVRQHERSGEVAEMAAVGSKREFILEESELSASSVRLKTRRLAVTASPEDSASPASSGNSTCESVSSVNVLASCCSSSRSSELAKESPKFADLEENAVNVEYIATSAGHSVDFRDRREQMTPSSEDQAQRGELESTARPPESNPHRRSTAEKMPTEDELEDFFAAAEKNLQKQFIDKYNFDIVKDEPLEGRYEWVPVQLKP